PARRGAARPRPPRRLRRRKALDRGVSDPQRGRLLPRALAARRHRRVPRPARRGVAGSSAVVLLSGGIDSSTCAAIARAEGFELLALTVAYGQRHAREIDAARAAAKSLGAREHVVLEVDLRPVGGSALTSDLAVPKDRRDLGSDI